MKWEVTQSLLLISTGSNDSSRYTQDLIQLDYRGHASCYSDPCLATISTPLKFDAWKKRLAKHPDKAYQHYITMGLEHGFHIGVDETASFVSAWHNMQSAMENSQIAKASKGNILGPFSPDIAPHVHINRNGAIPKKYQQGKCSHIRIRLSQKVVTLMTPLVKTCVHCPT